MCGGWKFFESVAIQLKNAARAGAKHRSWLTFQTCPPAFTASMGPLLLMVSGAFAAAVVSFAKGQCPAGLLFVQSPITPVSQRQLLAPSRTWKTNASLVHRRYPLQHVSHNQSGSAGGNIAPIWLSQSGIARRRTSLKPPTRDDPFLLKTPPSFENNRNLPFNNSTRGRRPLPTARSGTPGRTRRKRSSPWLRRWSP